MPTTKNKPTSENIIAKADDFLEWFLPKIEKFPRNYKFLIGGRIIELLLALQDDLIDAYYRREKVEQLRSANLRIEKLRHLLKVCTNLRFITVDQLEYATRALHDLGSLVGGWLRYAEARRVEA